MNAYAAAVIAENVAADVDMNAPEMLLLLGGSLRSVELALSERIVVLAAEESAPVSGVAPTGMAPKGYVSSF